jgi:hypothetical protein
MAASDRAVKEVIMGDCWGAESSARRAGPPFHPGHLPQHGCQLHPAAKRSMKQTKSSIVSAGTRVLPSQLA